jgi:ubiquitin-like modifier-activating enzyme 5
MSTEETLRARIAELEAQLAESRQQQGTRRERIAEMSSEVVDSNPYSRLMALKRMGIVENYEKGTALLRVLLRFHQYMSAATRI